MKIKKIFFCVQYLIILNPLITKVSVVEACVYAAVKLLANVKLIVDV